jgi:hypothetical protein
VFRQRMGEDLDSLEFDELCGRFDGGSGGRGLR